MLPGKLKKLLANFIEMGKLTKNQKKAQELLETGKEYSLEEASKLVKDITFTKFDASVDIDIRLGVDPKKADQMVSGVVSLPHGVGKDVRVLVLCTPDKEQDAKDAGADHVGLDDYVEKIEKGWTDIDVIITMPTVMAKVGKLGRVCRTKRSDAESQIRNSYNGRCAGSERGKGWKDRFQGRQVWNHSYQHW